MSHTSDDRILSLLENACQMAKVGGWELDLTSMLLTWSSEVFRIHDLPVGHEVSLEEAIGFYQGQSREMIEAAVGRGIEHHEPWDLELRIRTAKGRPVWVRAIGQPEVVDGKCIRLRGTFQDISERKRSQRSAQLTQYAVDQFPDAVFFVRKDGKIGYSNLRSETHFGYSREELASTDVGKILPDVPTAHWPERFEEIKLKQSVTREGRYRHRDGTVHDCEWLASYLDYEGEEYVVATVRDLTQAKADAELRNVLFERSTDAHLIFDETGIVECNQAAVDMLRMGSKEELLAHHPAVFSPEYQPDGRLSMEKRLEMDGRARQQGYHRFDWVHTRGDGEDFPCEVTLNPVELTSGPALLVVWHDISDRIRAEQEVRQSRQQLDLALTNANVGLWDRDLITGECFFSETFKTQLGYSADVPWDSFEEWMSRLHPEDRDSAIHNIEDYLTGKRNFYSSTFRLRHHNGSYRWILSQGRAEWDASGTPIRLVGVHVDVTQRKIAEWERDNFFALSLDLFCVAGTDGYFRKLNRAWTRVLGHSTSEFYSRPLIDFVHPDDRQETLDAIGSLREGCNLVGFVNRFRHHDGHYIWLEWSAAAAPGDTLFAVARDVTERRNHQLRLVSLNKELASNSDELKRTVAALEQSNVELQQFAYAASHDLQTPLRAISSYAQFLQADYEGSLDETADQYLDRIVVGAARMRTLIKDLLSYSRVESKALPFEPTDLSETVHDVLTMLDASINETGAKINVGSLPTVPADAAQMSQLFLNLIGNSIKYHGQRPPEISVSAKVEVDTGIPDPASRWVITIEDNGIGISDKHHAKIFEIFRRLHTEQAYPGTGIGLALCRRIVQRHGGRIWVESTEGEGSRFRFTLRHLA